MHKIQRPSGIGFRFNQDRRTRADCTPPCSPLANGQPFLAIETVAFGDEMVEGCMVMSG
jgi:hypothetical protein